MVEPGTRVVTRRGFERARSDGPGLAERARGIGIHPLGVAVLEARGIESVEAQARHVSPRLCDLRPPATMAGFAEAIDLLYDALRHGRRIGVFGDYDVDGVSTAAILGSYLEALGHPVLSRVASRHHGYGLGIADAAAFHAAGVELLLLGDLGTSDHEALEWLSCRGIKTIVIDHHQVPETMPAADALINPHRGDCRFPFKGLCSAGVGFYLCAALRTTLVEHGAAAPDPRYLLDLVALATVCDMVPLLDENRILVRNGLRLYQQPKRHGIRAMLARAGIDADEPIDADHLAYRLGPRINAPGRLGEADPALLLLRAPTDPEARIRAEQVEALNGRRKLHTERVVAEALARLGADPRTAARSGLVVASVDWPAGIVGIAANAVVEHFHRPALVLAIDRAADEARGSARSVAGIDVRAALARCRDLLVRHGGHPQAAGVTVRPERILELVEAFDAAIADQGGEREPVADVLIDGMLPLAEIDELAIAGIAAAGPYGVGFPPPLFLCEAIVESVRVLRERHLSLVLRQGQTVREAIAFGQASTAVLAGDRVFAVFSPRMNHFRGRKRVQLQVERLWK